VAYAKPGARLDTTRKHCTSCVSPRAVSTQPFGLFQTPGAAGTLARRRTAKSVLRALGRRATSTCQLAELTRYCAGLPENERAAAGPLQARLEAERVRARARMVRTLDCEPRGAGLEA